jgi:hypothetical protein
MAKRIEDKSLLAYAMVGAQARFTEIKRELAAILKMFPELGRAGGGGVPGGGILSPFPKPQPRRKRRKLTAAERKAIGLRMKKYWSERRKAKANSGR